MIQNNSRKYFRSLAALVFTSALVVLFINCSSGGGGGGSGTGVGDGAGSTVLGSVTAISAGYDSACVLKNDGTVWCWGDNSVGQLGTDVGVTHFSESAVKVSGISTATAVSVGGFFACATLSSGKVLCWGSGGSGRLGNGSQADSMAPVEVYGITTATSAIATGSNHACVILIGGAIKCWGAAAGGQLGAGSFSGVSSCIVPNDCQLTAVDVNGISNAVKISAGASSTCALLADTTVHCWGSNTSGELGIGSTTQSSSNIPAATAATNIIQLSTGSHYHTCALNPAGEISCWGFNRYGQIGNGDSAGPTTCTSYSCAKSAITMVNYTATQVSSGYGFTCAVATDQSVQCWGLNENADLGFSEGPDLCGSSNCSLFPGGVGSLSGVTSISSGTSYACAILTDKSVRCWGEISSITFDSETEVAQNPNTLDLPLPGATGSTPVTGPHILVISKGGSPNSTNGSAGTAGGSVTSSPAGITCANCTSTYATFDHNTVITLNTTLNGGTFNATWGGDCSSNTVTLDKDRFCTITFNNGTAQTLPVGGTLYNLSVNKTGSGTGTITSTTTPASGAAINCGSICSRTYGATTNVNLTAVPSSGHTFLGWGGDCAGLGISNPTSIPLNGNRICTAVFMSP